MEVSKLASSIRILVIDDEQDICTYLVDLLTSQGYAVNSLTDPRLVLEQLRQQSYHIIILDLRLSELEGIEILKNIRKADSDVAVVIHTAFPTIESAIESLKLNVSDYLRKPVPKAQLLAVLEGICQRKGLLNHPERALQQHIGRTIRQLRKGRGLTLRDLARRADLSISLISQIERAESSASVSSLLRISSALGCKLAEFFGDY